MRAGRPAPRPCRDRQWQAFSEPLHQVGHVVAHHSIPMVETHGAGKRACWACMHASTCTPLLVMCKWHTVPVLKLCLASCRLGQASQPPHIGSLSSFQRQPRRWQDARDCGPWGGGDWPPIDTAAQFTRASCPYPFGSVIAQLFPHAPQTSGRSGRCCCRETGCAIRSFARRCRRSPE